MDSRSLSNGLVGMTTLAGIETKTDDQMERETGIEPATNGLGSRDSTTELLPHFLLFVPRSFDFAADSGCRLPPALTPAKRLKLLPPVAE